MLNQVSIQHYLGFKGAGFRALFQVSVAYCNYHPFMPNSNIILNPAQDPPIALKSSMLQGFLIISQEIQQQAACFSLEEHPLL